ncbi:MAG TPA: MMPL family transporter, partial [Solirubrobacterales bacterium]
MRRFATWITGHRKTVIFGWILGLVVIGMIAGNKGANFSEEFKLPSSDSTEAYELLEDEFGGQSGGTATIVWRADEGVESPQVEKTMEGVFKSVEEKPHVTEVASPYKGGEGAAAISEDGKIAYATIQYNVQGNKLNKDDTKEIIKTAEAASGNGLDVQLGGQPIEEAKEESGDSSFAIGLLAAIIILLLAFGSVVAMGLPIITALLALGVGLSLVTLGTWIFDTAEFAPVLALMIGLGVGIDYALFILTRFRNNLDEGLEPRQAAITAVDTAGRAVLFAGTTVIIALMGMFLLNITFLYGVAVAAALAVLFT